MLTDGCGRGDCGCGCGFEITSWSLDYSSAHLAVADGNGFGHGGDCGCGGGNDNCPLDYSSAYLLWWMRQWLWLLLNFHLILPVYPFDLSMGISSLIPAYAIKRLYLQAVCYGKTTDLSRVTQLGYTL